MRKENVVKSCQKTFKGLSDSGLGVGIAHQYHPDRSKVLEVQRAFC